MSELRRCCACHLRSSGLVLAVVTAAVPRFSPGLRYPVCFPESKHPVGSHGNPGLSVACEQEAASMERELRSLVRVGTSPAARRAKKPQPPFFLSSSRRFPAHLTFSTFLLHHLAVCSFLSVFIRGVPGAPFPALPFASACSIPRLNSVAIRSPAPAPHRPRLREAAVPCRSHP